MAAEAVVFGLLVTVYFYLRTRIGFPPFSVSGNYSLTFPLVNTLVLMLSAVFAWRSVKAIEVGKSRTSQNWIWATLVLSLVFVIGQIVEYQHTGFHVSDAAFGGVFFALMAFHALHVLGGGFFLAINALRIRAGDFDKSHYAPVAAGAWFWYFVCLVWLVLFAVLFLA